MIILLNCTITGIVLLGQIMRHVDQKGYSEYLIIDNSI